MALEPNPTHGDMRVYKALPGVGGPGIRLAEVARRARQPVADVRLTLRGFEHLGYVTGRGGWWRRTR